MGIQVQLAALDRHLLNEVPTFEAYPSVGDCYPVNYYHKSNRKKQSKNPVGGIELAREY